MILEQLYIVTAFTALLMAIIYIVGADVYDYREVAMQRQVKLHPSTHRNRARPLVSILLVTQNDDASVRQCLDSFRVSVYRKVEIIILDCASTDTTREVVQHYQQEYPKKAITLVARRTHAISARAIADGLKKYTAGELVMVSDVTRLVEKRALTNAVTHFNANRQLSILNANCRTVFSYSVVGLFQEYESLLRYRWKKIGSVFNADYSLTNESLMYRRQALLRMLRQGNAHLVQTRSAVQQLGLKRKSYYYASNVVVNRQPAKSYQAMIGERYYIQRGRLDDIISRRSLILNRDKRHSPYFSMVRLPLALVVGLVAVSLPVLLSYFIYMAFTLNEPAFFIASWAALILFVVLAVWDDDYLQLKQKVAYSLFAPMTYGLFYVLSFVQIFVIAFGLISRCMRFRDKIRSLHLTV